MKVVVYKHTELETTLINTKWPMTFSIFREFCFGRLLWQPWFWQLHKVNWHHWSLQCNASATASILAESSYFHIGVLTMSPQFNEECSSNKQNNQDIQLFSCSGWRWRLKERSEGSWNTDVLNARVLTSLLWVYFEILIKKKIISIPYNL